MYLEVLATAEVLVEGCGLDERSDAGRATLSVFPTSGCRTTRNPYTLWAGTVRLSPRPA